MCNSDIFLLPSRLEGIPKVALEAAASGLPLHCVSRLRARCRSSMGSTGFQVGTIEEMMQALGKLIAEGSSAWSKWERLPGKHMGSLRLGCGKQARCRMPILK